MKIIIVSKTKMASNECVGGIVIETGKFVRLLDQSGSNQPIDCDFEIGEIWDIEFNERYNSNAPHKEDVLITSKSYTEQRASKENLSNWVQKNFPDKVWNGNPDVLFDGMIRFTTSGSGYISHENGVPEFSVGFWISDRNLTRRDYQGKVRYSYPSAGNWRSITYVGKDEPIDTIPAGTLMRVSLARWWSPDDNDLEERCYLQLSGWYLD